MGIPLRLLGGAAVEYHAHRGDNHEARQLKDVDLVTYRSSRVAVSKMLEKRGYVADRYVMAYFGDERFLYLHSEGGYKVDVFFEKLNFNHPIDLKPEGGPPRIELDYPTLALADLLLSKLQIHSPRAKDITDLHTLLSAHELAEEDVPERINVARLASVLADDWGFYYDAKANLQRLTDLETRPDESSARAKGRALELLRRIDAEPKTGRWRSREKAGTGRKWWNDVEELVR